MLVVVALPMLLQGWIILADEFLYHRARGLPRWERVGHPLDTLSLLACFAFVLWTPPGDAAHRIYGVLGGGSLLLVTKDEWVHAERCLPGEHWLHSILFILHPMVLLALALAWPELHVPSGLTEPLRRIILAQTAAMTAFLGYQVVYWNLWRDPDAAGEGHPSADP